MDKYEYNLKIDQIKSYYGEENYEAAADICDTIPWGKVKNVNALVKAAEVYDKVSRYEEARDILLAAYDRSPIGRNIVYRLCEEVLKMQDFAAAGDYYQEFVEIAPHDNQRYVLRYRIRKAEGASGQELIQILEEFKEQEYTEEWAYELAYLYHKNGMSEKCIEACDELILWFGDGPYVERALELKMLYQPLTKAQEDKYRRFRLAKEGITTIATEEMVQAGEYGHDQVEIPQINYDPEKFNTVNLQEEIARGMQQILAATEKETVSDTMDTIKRITEEIPYLQINKEGNGQSAIHIETDQEINDSIKVNFQEMLGEDADGQMSLVMGGDANVEQQITGQLSIDDILGEWEKTRRAAEAVLNDAEQRKLDSAKARALQEAGDIMDRLNDVIPKLEQGVSPKELLEEEYLQEEKMEKTAADIAEELLDLPEESVDPSQIESVEDAVTVENLTTDRIANLALVQPAKMAEVDEDALIKQLTANLPEIMDLALPEEIDAEEEDATASLIQDDQVIGEISEPAGLDLDQLAAEEADSQAALQEADQETEEVATKPEFSEDSDGDIFATKRLPNLELSLEELLGQTVRDVTAEEAQAAEAAIQGSLGEKAAEIAAGAAVAGLAGETVSLAADVAGNAADLAAGAAEAELTADSTAPVPSITQILPEISIPEGLEEEFNQATAPDQGEEAEADSAAAAQDDLLGDMPTDEELEEEALEAGRQLALEEEKQKTKKMPVIPENLDEEEAEKPAKLQELSEDQKAMFSYFIPVKGMEAQICNAVNGLSAHLKSEETAGSSNVIIQGGHGTGKTVLATSLIKVLQLETGKLTGRIGKIDALALNKKDLQSLLKKVAGGCLIIERAGDLSRETVLTLALLLAQNRSGLLVILEDTSKGIKKALSQDSSFAKMFTQTIDVPVFNNDDLVTFAKAYANELGYEIDEMAVLALYKRISNISRLDQATTISEVKEIVDEAIEREAHWGLKKAISILTASRYTDEDRIVLRERNFD